LQYEYSTIGGLHDINYLKNQLDAPILYAPSITERKVSTPLCLFNQTSPIDFAVASGNGNRLFTGKLHVQITNKLR
jgi:hypothetical protein